MLLASALIRTGYSLEKYPISIDNSSMHSKKFFIPHAETPEASERIYQVIKGTAQSQLAGIISERRIFRIEFMQGEIRYEFEVGKNANFHEVQDEVMAIYELGEAYLVCTPSRGVDPRFPMPVIIGKSDTTEVEDFEA